jgi:cystathionine beta-lyase/cystathionine gamma-synthase
MEVSMKESTVCVHSGSYPDLNEGGINTPIYLSSSHFFPHPSGELRYPRFSNIPTQLAPAEKIADLEHGEKCLVFSSGMAAISTTFLALLAKGDHCVVQSEIYGGTHTFITRALKDYGIGFSLVESNDVKAFEREITPKTKLLYIESPSNPLLRLVDVSKIASVAKKQNIISVIDNTFATPINQKPLDMGIDVVLHSGTKYLGGHSDIACGAVVSKKNMIDRIAETQKSFGGSLDCFSCYLLDRGLKTLALRVSRQSDNALKIARWLGKSAKIEAVHYPGLPSHPDHGLARRQMCGYGGMVTFTMKGSLEAARIFTKGLSIIKGAVSLGGVESIICFPFETSHARVKKEQREKMGVRDTTLRLSVGIEDPEDLIADLKQALESV